MFDIDNIYTDISGKRFLVKFNASSEFAAKHFCASWGIGVRSVFRIADLYTKGTYVILDTPDRKKTIQLAQELNRLMLEKNQ